MKHLFFPAAPIAYLYGSECLVSATICPQSFSKQVYEPVTVSIIFYILLNCCYLVVLISPLPMDSVRAKMQPEDLRYH